MRWLQLAGVAMLGTVGACTEGEVQVSRLDTAAPPTGDRLVAGLSIDKVTLNQGVQVVLWQDGKRGRDQPPVVARRDGLLRVFVTLEEGWEPRRVAAVLTGQSGAHAFEQVTEQRVEKNSRNGNLETTLDFELGGKTLRSDVTLHVELHEVDGAPGGGDPADVVWDSQLREGRDIVESDVLTVVLIPVEYNFDGSGRLPDTSPSQVALVQQRMSALFPAREVEVVVGDTLSWGSELGSQDTYGWSDLLDTVSRVRDYDTETDELTQNTYYYGMVQPAADKEEHCRIGCIGGLSLMGWDVTDPYYRASVGLGFADEASAEIVAHEVGHAHGRNHSPCQVPPGNFDEEYPFETGETGVWGYDTATGLLQSPSGHDLMGYCLPFGVSRYSYEALLERIQLISVQERAAGPVAPMPAMRVGPGGELTRREPVPTRRLQGALSATVAVFDASGAHVEDRAAHLFPTSHGDGGLVVLDEELPAGFTARLVGREEPRPARWPRATTRP